MHDPWTSRLSEVVDGELSPADAREFEQHAAECDVCRATLAELRDVLAAAATLDDAEPANDLWPGIAARIGTTSLPTTFEVVSIESAASARTQRRFSFSGAQLAAAAMVLMTLTGGTVWFLTNGSIGATPAPAMTSGTIIQTSGGDATRLVADATEPDPVVSRDVAALEQVLEQNRAQLDPSTVEIVERSIDAIDRAIEDAREALVGDPGNPYLTRQLDNTMRKKLDILQRATDTRRAGT